MNHARSSRLFVHLEIVCSESLKDEARSPSVKRLLLTRARASQYTAIFILLTYYSPSRHHSTFCWAFSGYAALLPRRSSSGIKHTVCCTKMVINNKSVNTERNLIDAHSHVGSCLTVSRRLLLTRDMRRPAPEAMATFSRTQQLSNCFARFVRYRWTELTELVQKASTTAFLIELDINYVTTGSIMAVFSCTRVISIFF